MSSNCVGSQLEEPSTLVFFVNGKRVSCFNADPKCTLLVYLREHLKLTGTKLGCGEGGCGACTVMISRMEYQTNKIVHYSANACIIPLCSLHGQSVTTVEGIGSTRSRLHSVQERLAKSSGSQCGFCTPGIVMSMYALLRNSPEPNLEDIEVAFQGNLCRCTGYRPILEGYSTFTKEYKCSMGDKCCRNSVSNGCDLNTSTELFQKSEFTPYDCTQEPIFPPELHVSDSLDKQFLFFHKQNIKWYRPTNLSQLLTLKSKYPEAKLIVGNTEIGIEMNIKNFNYPVLIDPSKVIELTQVEEDADGITFGAAVRLTKINDILKEKIRHEPESKTRFFKCASDMFHYFAGKQVRNFASLGGNIMTASPISDMNPIFLANNVELSVASSIDGRVSLKKINMGKGFFTSYRKIIIQPHEVLLSVRFPRTKENQFVKSFKQARRRDDDIAIVNAAISVTFMGKTNVIEKVNLAFGGVAPITVLAPKTTSAMANKKWDKTLVNAVTKSLSEELTLTDNAPGGMIAYRRSLIISLFYKLYLSISKDLPKAGITNTYLSTDEKSGADVFHTLPLKSAQIFEKVSSSQPSSDPIGKPIVHVSGLKQTTGEAMYCDDVPRMENELYLAFVYSSKAHAEIISIDATVALNLAGVHAFFSSKDLTEEQNSVGPIFHDEQLFATKATCHGQVIGAIAADTQSIAKEAARLVKVEYKELTPLIVTIEDAIEKQSFFDGYPQTIAYGDTEEAFKKADHLISGTCRMGGQEHFYLETQAALAMPRDNDEIEIISSTQHPSEIQRLTAHVLSLPASHIVCRVKRLGGGFGGKESRGYPTAVSVALAAYKLQRPVRMMLSRNEDMMITGTRHPFLFKYKASCTKDGRLTGYEAECYCNAGCSMDLSFSVLDRAMRHIENCYNIPNVKVSGWLCKTNLPSNTAFRGFGGPQGMFCAENVIRHVAEVTNKPVDEIMELNLYKDGDRTFYKQLLEFCPIRRCFQECIEQANYHQECDLIKQFNSQNRWRKRGIAIVPTKYGIAFGVPHLNQAGALLNIYLDGSVLLSHGGVEIGQGLHTKMIQVASRALEIPPDLIHIAETATDKVPNTSATAASVGSDINGMAVIKACEVLNSRLKPIKERYPELSWKDRINKAYLDCVSLSATGFYKTPDLDKKTYNYFTTGVGISVVEVDCLTGDHQILKTDIVMDIGSSLNPAIDIGQIEGAFTQGYGLFVLEEMVYSPTGVVYSTGPGMYKLPGFADIPGTFNVTLLTGAPNPRAVYSSKAVGEPPLFIGSSVFFAIKDAISAAREQNGYSKYSKYFQLTSPATAARIRMACEDQFTEAVHKPDEGFVGWNVMP